MTRNSIARLAGFSAGAAMVLGFAAPVAAQSVAELQAQIAALMAQLSAMSGGASASSAITSDLTVGSTGSQVVALQNSLVSGGYLVMPAGVAPGYFGALTKTAVAKWQAAVGLPATGYFGPLSRAKFTGSVAGTTTGGTTTGGTVSGTITTPGVEGTLTVTSAPVSNSTLYEGENMVTVLGFKAEADLSDIAIQRVKIDLGTTNTLYRDILSKIYLVDDAGKTLASADLNNSTVVRNGSNEYELTMTGFSSVVAKDATRNYMIKADVQDTIDSGDLTSYTITLADNGVRGIDGAGIDLYSPALDTDVTKSVTFASSLTDSASLTVSANSSNPSSREIVAASGSSDNEADKVVLMVFDVRAEKDAIKVTDLQNFVITKSASATAGATASTSYLYVGNGTGGQLLASAALTGSDADFTDIDYTIPAGTTRTFTLAVDVRSANAVQATFDASFTGNTTNVIAENSLGDTINSVSGSADAN
ncbi:MAG TPA: peptidoglycan-binding domain-containing protein, partial [Parcubacteria group bacterium]|nr:peptidoglycan-binding domain-containing protein [Parcubacteria group bacterium]